MPAVRTDGTGRRVVLAVLVGAGLALEPAERAGGGTAAGWGLDWVADVLWLQVNVAWEARQAAAVRRLGRLALAAAPDETAFRVGLARMVAHDLPAWREEAAPTAPRAVVEAWRREGLEEALAVLAAGEADDPRLWLEAGGLALHAGGDAERAAAFFRRAAEMPGAPGHAARLHVHLLTSLGREAEARAWRERMEGGAGPDGEAL
jgi:hypothetical protein